MGESLGGLGGRTWEGEWADLARAVYVLWAALGM